ncbi:hypothetical protein AJ78_02635 [Emergomyces pasteurianus Ep9510]|uniref:RGS domain-containing protein n=1 Tax=Emergomyces pasteurianus Ep9510 TaxID=1447872 RepID=A0A1J9QPR6_9EURO|nr:hypothetical protein AJ78_02635 [Emergomyces pasteurianus Ep9510]
MADDPLPGWDEGLKPLDALGIFYVIFNIVWTLLVVSGLIWLWRNKTIPSVRMRNVPLAICSVIFLHGYGGVYVLAYPLKGILSCGLEFWLMCGILPVGIALFQATNVQLLSVATLQQRFLRDDGTFEEPTPREIRCPFNKFKCWWTHLSWAKKTMFAIAIGMFIEICMSLFVYFGSRKFHSYGLWSTFENHLQCRQGVEWLPTIIWQFFWSWIFAPYVLFKIRNIRDVHCWRLQTTLCIVSGLIALPMWLGSLYSPNLEYRQMNTYWAPPLWFLPGIMMMEIATLFFPFYEVMFAQKLQARALKALGTIEGFRRSSFTPKNNNPDYSIVPLEKVLKGDSGPFLHFAATHDFSGENIMFLNHVRDWKAAWAQSPANLKLQKANAEEIESYRRHLYNVALEIYVTYVHLFGAEFPINIESEIYRDLKTVFMPAAMTLMRLPKRISGQFSAPATPNDIETATEVFPFRPVPDSDISLRKRTPAQEYEDILYRGHQNIINMVPRLPPDAIIPSAFNEYVFDDAAASVKVLILRNTWPKYVDYQASIRKLEAKKHMYARFAALFSRQAPSTIRG